MLDGTANPYLALAGILGAGHEGIRNNAALEVRDCSDGRSAAELDDEGRKALGITQRLPLNPQEARKAFRESEVMKKIFGKVVVETYLNVNETLAKEFSKEDKTEALTFMIENF